MLRSGAGCLEAACQSHLLTLGGVDDAGVPAVGNGGRGGALQVACDCNTCKV